MNAFVLYLLFLKASLMSFGGMASLPIVREDFVIHYQMMTDRDLNAAVSAARVTPGPIGLYIVSVGWFVGGIPGAAAACLAMMTPAFLIILLMRLLGARAEHPVVRRTIRAVSLAAAGLILAVNYPLARDAIQTWFEAGLAVISFCLLLFTRRGTLEIMFGAGLVSWLAYFFHG